VGVALYILNNRLDISKEFKHEKKHDSEIAEAVEIGI
jgi:hypothetical protein